MWEWAYTHHPDSRSYGCSAVNEKKLQSKSTVSPTVLRYAARAEHQYLSSCGYARLRLFKVSRLLNYLRENRMTHKLHCYITETTKPYLSILCNP